MSIQEDRAEPGSRAEAEAGFEAEFKRLGDEAAELPSGTSGADDPPEGKDATESAAGQGAQPLPADAAPSDGKPAGEVSNDLWAKAPPELKTAYEAERQQRERWESTARSQSRAASQAGRRLAEIEAQLASSRRAGGEGAEGAEGTRDERMTRLKEEYPDIAEPLLGELDVLRQEVAKLSGANTANEQERNEANLREQYGYLETKHPEWRKEVLDPRFGQWMEAQPRYVHDAIQRNANVVVDGVETADILSRFKSEALGQADPARERLQSRRSDQLDAGRTAQTRHPAATSQSANDFDSEFKRLGELERRASAGQRRR